MNNQQIEDLTYISLYLDMLHDAEVNLATAVDAKTDAYDDLITDDIRMQMLEIDEKCDGDIAEIEERLVQLRNDIKKSVLEHGSTVKGEHMMATWNKGRVSWDTAALKGYAVTHPEVNQLRKQGDPTVSIRKIK